MTPQPKPGRFRREDLQRAYEHGFHQEYDHDSFALLDRFQWLTDRAGSAAAGAERLAAMLEGAADALRELARERRRELPFLRRMDRLHAEVREP